MLAVGELLDEDAATWRVSAEEPLESLLSRPELRQLGALMAVDADGRLRGVVTIQQVQRALTAALPEPRLTAANPVLRGPISPVTTGESGASRVTPERTGERIESGPVPHGAATRITCLHMTS